MFTNWNCDEYLEITQTGKDTQVFVYFNSRISFKTCKHCGAVSSFSVLNGFLPPYSAFYPLFRLLSLRFRLLFIPSSVSYSFGFIPIYPLLSQFRVLSSFPPFRFRHSVSAFYPNPLPSATIFSAKIIFSRENVRTTRVHSMHSTPDIPGEGSKICWRIGAEKLVDFFIEKIPHQRFLLKFSYP